MKMKKGLVSVAGLLAASSVMAAMSFSSAEVKSDMNISVDKSSEALLALKANEEHKAVEGSNAKNELSIDLGKGYNGLNSGVQTDSRYYWDDLFYVQNNSDETIHVKISQDKDNNKLANERTPEIKKGKPLDEDTDHPSNEAILKYEDGVLTNVVEFTLAPNAQRAIDINLLTNDGTKLGDTASSLIVKADSIETPNKKGEDTRP